MSEANDLLRTLTQTWVKKLNAAVQYKKPFTEDAKEACNFFDGEHNWMWRDSYARGERGYNTSISAPNFRIQVNKVFELCDLFGAVMYHRNPTRTVTVTERPEITPESVGIELAPGQDPATLPPEQLQILQMALEEEKGKQRRHGTAVLLDKYLNWTPAELNLKQHGQKWVREALMKGMGTMWTEMIELESSGDGTRPPTKIVGSFYDSVDNLVIDPDWDNMDDMLWCARRCVHPIDVVAEEYGIPEEKLRKHLEGGNEVKIDREPKSKKDKIEKTHDLVTYWKIWTKCGLGDRFKNVPKQYRGMFDSLSKHCYLVICEGIEFPLNMPPEIMEQSLEEGGAVSQEIITRTSWPIPFYADPNGWPFVPLWFHWKPGYSYPISHIRPAIGELRLLNWALSFAATRIATSCETMIAVQKAADQTIKDQILAPSEGGFKLIEISELLGRGIGDIISVFQLPQVSKDLWDIIGSISEQFAQRTGLTELAFGYTRSMFRSASEANIKQENISIRPDNMSNQLEDAMSLLARREALAARWLLEPQDVVPVLGAVGAIAWEKNVVTTDLVDLSRDFLFRVEAGSARKPNKATRVEQMQLSVQTLGPIVSGLVGSGIVDPYNALMRDWADSLDIDATPYMIPPPPPPQALPPPPPPAEQGAAAGVGEEVGPQPDMEQMPPEFMPQ